MSIGFVLTIMVLTAEEKVSIIEHYFWSYRIGCQNGPKLRHVREHYKEQFNRTAPSIKTILAIVEKFHHTGSVLCQRKETAGRPRTVTTKKNHKRLLQEVLRPTHTYAARCGASRCRHFFILYFKWQLAKASESMQRVALRCIVLRCEKNCLQRIKFTCCIGFGHDRQDSDVPE